MNALVDDQVGTLAEALAALLAGVAFLSSVDAMMAIVVRAVDETLAALHADVRFFPRVGPLVGDQGGVTAEAFPTPQTRVRPLSRMSSLMRHQL